MEDEKCEEKGVLGRKERGREGNSYVLRSRDYCLFVVVVITKCLRNWVSRSGNLSD